jgi:hypothetical protein
LEIETGENGRIRLQRLRSQLSLEIFKAVCGTLNQLPEVRALNSCHITREDGSKAMFAVELRTWTGGLQATPLQRGLLTHPLALCRTVADRTINQERGVDVVGEDRGHTRLPIEPGDIILASLIERLCGTGSGW